MRAVSAQQRPDRKRKIQREKAVERSAPNVHLPKQSGGSVVARKIEQISESYPLPDHRESSASNAQSRRYSKIFECSEPHSMHSAPEQRSQHEREHKTLEKAKAIQRIVITVPP